MSYKIVLISIIHRKNSSEILLTKRKREPELDKWSLPGGTGAFEIESDPGKAIFLEVQSDFGVNIINPKLFAVKCVSATEPILRFYFEGELDGEPKIKGVKTIKELRWFKIEDAIQLDLAFKEIDLEVLNQFDNSVK